ncbi:DUF481 domain-containing protein [bacterium]|nr:DUF481 domain-containing protein [bacterium]
MFSHRFFCFIALVLFLSFSAYAEKKFRVQLESGAVWQQLNDVKIAPNSGSLVEFDKFNKGPFFHYRLEGFYNLNRRHALRVVYAPLSLSVSKVLGESVNFNGTGFNSIDPLNIDYKFNSYRVGYLYRLLDGEKSSLQVGLTIKVRDAKIEFSQNSLNSKYDNVGVVPLLYLAYQLRLDSLWSVFSDVDFAAAPQGRATDFTIKLRRKLNDRFEAGLGYRTLEGGADNDKVYSFSWFHYVAADLSARF